MNLALPKVFKAMLGLAWMGAAVMPAARAQGMGNTTPLNLPLPEETLTLITCKLTQPPRPGDVPVFDHPQDAAKTVGVYHYNVWVPRGYKTGFEQWPCMFVMSAAGNATMDNMEPWLKSHGFIVVLLVEAKNGDWPPIVGNFLAAHDDVVQRLRVGAKYATGQSGGARASSVFVQLRPGFRGLVLQAAGAATAGPSNSYWVTKIRQNRELRVAMTMGTSDDNKAEEDKMRMVLDRMRYTVIEFNGGHVWAPADIFAKAMAWVMLGNSAGGGPDDAGGLNGGGNTGGDSTKGDSFDEFFHHK